MPKYLLLGNSAGGIGATEAIRAGDAAGSLAIVSEEPYLAYSRPLISEYLAGETTLEKMLYRPGDFYERNGVQAYLGIKALRLNLEERFVELEGGRRLEWEKLLLATGGKPFIPKIVGLDKRNIFTFTTLDDAKKIDSVLQRGQRVVVLGGGLIGISAAEALVKRGAEVVMVELQDKVLPTVLDAEASFLVAQALERAGVSLFTGHTVQEILDRPGEKGVVGGVVLDNGERLPCDLVIIAIGVVPRTDLVAGTRVAVNRGILVDRHLETNVPGVYACGDVAEAYDFAYGERRLTPIWPNAYLGGRIAGSNMAGVDRDYPGGTAMNSFKYFGLAVVSAGITNPGEGQGYEIIQRKPQNGAGSLYRKFVLKEGRLVGMILAGQIQRAGIILGLMRDGIPVSEFKPALLSEDFGFLSLPEDLRWQRLAFTERQLAAVKEAG